MTSKSKFIALLAAAAFLSPLAQADISSLTPTQISVMTPEQIGAILPGDIARMTGINFRHFCLSKLR